MSNSFYDKVMVATLDIEGVQDVFNEKIGKLRGSARVEGKCLPGLRDQLIKTKCDDFATLYHKF